jgi:predicted RecB family nuclease
VQPLSKSKLLAFRQCHKRLWLEVHKPELREDSAATQARFQTGYEVGDIVKRIYDPEGKASIIDVDTEGFDGAFARTAKLLVESHQPVFEAGFKANGALAFVDVMLPDFDNGRPVWRMVEVKSSTSVKEYHRDDIAIQAFVVQSTGVKVKSVSLAYIDNSWVYPGNEDYRGLLKEIDLTAETFARIDEVKAWIAEAQSVVARLAEPGIAVGAHCHDPFDCGYCKYCNRNAPQTQYPVHWLPRFSSAKRERLSEQGVDDLRGVPDDLLSEKQSMVKEHTLAKAVFFDAAGAVSDLAPHGFPAYFLDFESIQFAVPIWKGTRPFQQITYQFSLHIVTESGQLSQTAFLDLSGNDPSEALATALITACGEHGPVFVYNAAFETTRIRELAERYHSLARQLQGILARVVDLLPIARNRYYHPSQQGSWSIKAVLPAAVPELSYDQLDGVNDGGTAMDAFCEAIQPGTSEERKRTIERQLLAYCRLDTFAMVRLWQFFSGRNGSPLQQ